MNETESQETKTADQTINSRPWLFKKGQSGNPSGRPKGSVSLKEYAKKYLSELDEEGKKEFMDGLDKDVIWKMAEGNPKNDVEIKGNLTISQVLDELDTDYKLRYDIAYGQETQGQIVEDQPPLQDQKQEGEIGTVQTEQSPS